VAASTKHRDDPAVRIVDFACGLQDELRDYRVVRGAVTVTLANSRAPFGERFTAAARVVRDVTARVELRTLVMEGLAHGVSNNTGDGYSEDDIDIGGREYWKPQTYGD